ncbi:MAG: hypothetical protein RDV48_28555 [Candidatus Eremiobacteraeota bacterium]|nr:hypothetical protein [Candidatus Eremiobacteraeota bacterium]
MEQSDFREIQRTFFSLTGIPLEDRETNLIAEGRMRADTLFHSLADFLFEKPGALPGLLMRVRTWRERYDEELFHAMEGYLHYLGENYREAAGCFFQSVAKNPGNLDSWLDLAFALHHLGNPYGAMILFNFPHVMALYRELGAGKCHYAMLEKISKELDRRKLDYRYEAREAIAGMLAAS